MQIRQLKIANFRGISSLLWKPGRPFCCVIGSGDSGKSTVLDAVEAVLSPRWFSFSEPDFRNCDTSSNIVVEATVGELSKTLKSDERFGLYVRGWTRDGNLRDEPEDDDEPVLTVRLTVDATLEPVWELVCDRLADARTLSNRDRALFGLLRLVGDDARQLSWAQGSVLSRLTGDSADAGARLAQAYKAAKDSAKLHEIESLAHAAEAAEGFAKGLGAYVEGGYAPGLELGRAGLSSGSIALLDGGVPLRLAGLGTRRLATLAIQKSAISEGAIVLVDEIEHGLEPHRIMGAIAQLKADQAKALKEARAVGQVLLTTHSDVVLGEVGAGGLFVCQTSRPGRETALLHPSDPAKIKSLMRHTPRALFARRILVCEGMTEVGMMLGIRGNWPERHDGMPIERFGAAITDGNGNEAAAISLALAELGYQVALFRDSDTEIPTGEKEKLATANVSVFEYGNGLNTEEAVFLAASDLRVQDLLAYAREERGEGAVDDNIVSKIPAISRELVKEHFMAWELSGDVSGEKLRRELGKLASQKRWFKDQRIGRGMAPIVWGVVQDDVGTPLAKAISATERWLYGD